MADPPQSAHFSDMFDTTKHPIIIGLYGISGSGKSFLLRELQKQHYSDEVILHEGSEMIGKCTLGGLEAFKVMSEDAKRRQREMAIEAIRTECLDTGKAAVVSGHFSLWSEGDNEPQVVCTDKDLDIFTHIIYLDVPAEEVSKFRRNDQRRQRPVLSIAQIEFWQSLEKHRLRPLCREHKILFIACPTHKDRYIVPELVQHWQEEFPASNLGKAEKDLDEVCRSKMRGSNTVLVFDADNTLGPHDSGNSFLQALPQEHDGHTLTLRLKEIFTSPLGYSFDAFRQATLLYEEAVPDWDDFSDLCDKVAHNFAMHPEIASFLKWTAKNKQIGVFVVTCGLVYVWEEVISQAGLSDSVFLIGGGFGREGYIVTPSIKGILVERLQQVHHKRVCAFGDSPLDLPMLKAADLATVVVGATEIRSKSMDAVLKDAIDREGLKARQVLLPGTAPMRLDASRLPITALEAPEFLNTLLAQECPKTSLRVTHATGTAATKLLTTPTRDRTVQGPALRQAHFNIGRHLAVSFLSDEIGLEAFDMENTHGDPTNGYRLSKEHKTLIVALMRGGEPMAQGANEALPRASFLHAFQPTNVMPDHVEGFSTVILVDSVINRGTTMVDFVKRIRDLDDTIQIVMVSNVVQSNALLPGSMLDQVAVGYEDKVCLVALRLSDNQYTGRGATDTGNRLFNTTHMD